MEEKTKKQYLFIFEYLRARDSRCEMVVRGLLHSSNDMGYAKLKSMEKMSEEFKEYRSCSLKLELKRIEDLLVEDK